MRNDAGVVMADQGSKKRYAHHPYTLATNDTFGAMADESRKAAMTSDVIFSRSQRALGSPISGIGMDKAHAIDMCTPPPSERALDDGQDVIDNTPGSTSAASFILSPSIEVMRAPTPPASPDQKALSKPARSEAPSSSGRKMASDSPTWATERREAIHVTDNLKHRGVDRWLLSPDDEVTMEPVNHSTPTIARRLDQSTRVLSPMVSRRIDEEVDELESTDDAAASSPAVVETYHPHATARTQADASSNIPGSPPAPNAKYRDQAVQTESISEDERLALSQAARDLIEALTPLTKGI